MKINLKPAAVAEACDLAGQAMAKQRAVAVNELRRVGYVDSVINAYLSNFDEARVTLEALAKQARAEMKS